VEFRYHWDALSDRSGFVVVYPQGEGDRWNVSLDSRAVDDVRFLSDLIDHLERQLPVDPRRVFVAGYVERRRDDLPRRLHAFRSRRGDCARRAGSGHEWPGSWPPLPGHDPPSANLDATQVMQNVFRTQTR
jgi:poly(3-hydroxybutyrate) depolymerase